MTAPTGDSALSPIVLGQGTGSVTGTTSQATSQTGETHPGFMNNATVWLLWYPVVPQVSAPRFRVAGQLSYNGNTYIAVYKLPAGQTPTVANICAGLVGYAEDLGSGAYYDFPGPVAAGDHIYIQIGGDSRYIGAYGGGSYTFTYPPPGPAPAPPVNPGQARATGHASARIGSPTDVGTPVTAAGHSSATADCSSTANVALAAAGHSTASVAESVEVIAEPDVAAGHSYARFTDATLTLDPDDAAGHSTVSVTCPRSVIPGVDPAAGGSTAVLTYVPDLAGNAPVSMTMRLTGSFLVIPPEDADPTVDELAEDDWEALVDAEAGVSTSVFHRSIPTVVVTMPQPFIVHGRPVMPRYVATLDTTFTARQGPNQIHVEDLQANHPRKPRPPDETAPWHARWSVDDLPDPGDGTYWLGAPSPADGTAGIAAAKQSWAEQDGKEPAWHSFFPFKPSVRAVDHYLPDGGVVHHPKGLHFNSQFIEHMWLEFGAARPQPFTWAIAGMIAAYPDPDYVHYVLDAGRNPDRVGFPRLAASDCYTDHRIADGLDYRTLLAYGRHGQLMTTRSDMWTSHTLRARSTTNYAPRMFFGVFDGNRSHVGAFQTLGMHSKSGTVDNGKAYEHRYYVLGRAQNHIDQAHASHLLIFEIRYWRKALGPDQLKANFDQIASTWQFHKYRRG